MIILNKDHDFLSLINSDKIVLVDFYADWCGPCKSLHPQLEKLEESSADEVEIIKVNVDHFSDIAATYGVRSIPALFYHKKAKVLHSSTGLKSANEMKDVLQTL